MRRSLITISLTAVALLAATVGAAHAGWEEGVAAFKAGKFADAASQFQTVVEQQPEWPGGHYMLGQTLLKLNRNQDALTHLRKAYDLNPNDVNVQLVLGKAYISNGRYADAAQLLSKIDASKLPGAQQAALHQMLAVSYDKSGQADRALGALGNAVKSNPNDAGLQFQYGTAALNAGDTSTAVRALEKAASLDPKDGEKQKVYIQALIRQGRETTGSAKTQAYQKAVAAAGKLASSSGSYDNLLLFGEAQLGATRYKEAAGTFQQAASKNSSDWLPLYYLGQAHTATGEYIQAERALKQALDRTNSSRDQVRIWLQLGFVYEKQKDFNQAKVAYQRAGNSAAVRRVEENQQIEEYNRQVEEEAARMKELDEERRKLEEELKELPGGGPPPR